MAQTRTSFRFFANALCFSFKIFQNRQNRKLMRVIAHNLRYTFKKSWKGVEMTTKSETTIKLSSILTCFSGRNNFMNRVNKTRKTQNWELWKITLASKSRHSLFILEQIFYLIKVISKWYISWNVFYISCSSIKTNSW